MKFSACSILLLFGDIAGALALSYTETPEPPKNWGVTLFEAFDSIDVFGPLNPLWYLSLSRQLNLALIAPTLSPIWVKPADPAQNKANSSFWFSVNPTHTYDNPPENIEVLLVPGGFGAMMNDNHEVIEFVKKTYPSLKYLITVCTGAGIAAKAGVLDGKRATTNKRAWKTVTAMGPDVEWVSPARWTVDGNIWTSSGVTAGLDLIFAFIEEVYGPKNATETQNSIEFNRVGDACDDAFAEKAKVPPSGDCHQS